MNPRVKARIEAEIQRELSDIIATELRDPVLKEFLPDIVGVELSANGQRATVYVFAGDEALREAVLSALARDAGFLRTELAHRMDLRRVPTLRFAWEDPLKRWPL
ncbi:30S ribosome-binding factor RbfA [Candidatus Acetothermia bacterium]|nr:MAG: 30S ribosome-binding factor RbfA [Candidatus Acetothermia bacterium]